MSKRKNQTSGDDDEDDDVLSDNEGDEVESPKPKSSSSSSSINSSTSKKKSKSNAEVSFDIGEKRKVTVSEFKGKLYVNIREFYEDKASGDLKPGSKGIALTIDQFNSLKSQMEDIDAAISNF